MAGNLIVLIASIILFSSCKPPEKAVARTFDSGIKAPLSQTYAAYFSAFLSETPSGTDASAFTLYVNPLSQIKADSVTLCIGSASDCKEGTEGRKFIEVQSTKKFENLQAFESKVAVKIQKDLKITVLGLDKDDKNIGNTIQFLPAE